jgi:hypothetical protein
MSTEKHQSKGGVAATTLVGSLTSGSTTITVADGSTYPTGSNGKFVITIDKDTASQETVLIQSRVNNVLTADPAGRGYDNSVASSHGNGATIEHTLAAAEIQQLNTHATDTTLDDHTQYLKVTTAASTYAPLTKVPTITSAFVSANEVTASNLYTNLTTTGPTVTVTVPASGVIKVTLSAALLAGTNDYAQYGFAMSGANTMAVGTNDRILAVGNAGTTQMYAANTFHITGLNAGSTTFTAKYKAAFGANAGFASRALIVETYP